MPKKKGTVAPFIFRTNFLSMTDMLQNGLDIVITCRTAVFSRTIRVLWENRSITLGVKVNSSLLDITTSVILTFNKAMVRCPTPLWLLVFPVPFVRAVVVVRTLQLGTQKVDLMAPVIARVVAEIGLRSPTTVVNVIQFREALKCRVVPGTVIWR